MDDEANDSPDSTGTADLKSNTEHVFSDGMADETGVAQPADNTPVQRHADPNGSGVNLTTRVNMASLQTDEEPAAELDSSPSLLSRRNVSGSSMLQRGIRALKPTPDRTPPSPRLSSSRSTSQEAEPSNTLCVAMPTAGEPSGSEGPMTPMNDAGPFVFDGSAGRASGRRVVASLAEAAAENGEGRSTIA